MLLAYQFNIGVIPCTRFELRKEQHNEAELPHVLLKAQWMMEMIRTRI
jgi:hypothetical protein